MLTFSWNSWANSAAKGNQVPSFSSFASELRTLVVSPHHLQGQVLELALFGNLVGGVELLDLARKVLD